MERQPSRRKSEIDREGRGFYLKLPDAGPDIISFRMAGCPGHRGLDRADLVVASP